ncbi:MAG: hypothetical protein EXR72_06205 [Myxococcales bacterium]|nr:hypothetical protein [Myxococcales bacterium]
MRRCVRTRSPGSGLATGDLNGDGLPDLIIGGETGKLSVLLNIPTPHPHCRDGSLSGGESDVDCGGTCPPCALKKACGAAADCHSGACTAGECSL